jgi:hypothetical protein
MTYSKSELGGTIVLLFGIAFLLWHIEKIGLVEILAYYLAKGHGTI